MRRVCSIALTVLLCVVLFAGCGSSNAAALINKADEIALSASERDVIYTVSMSVASNGGTNTIKTVTEKKETGVGTPNYKMISKTTVSSGSSAESSGTSAFVDGVFYTTKSGGKFKTNLSFDNEAVMNEYTQSTESVKIITDKMKSISVRKAEDGITILEYTYPAEYAKEYLTSIINGNGSSKADYVKLTSFKGQYEFYEDGSHKSSKMMIIGDAKYGENSVSVKLVSQTDYNKITDGIVVEAPQDADEYVYVDDLSKLSLVANAISNVMLSTDYSMGSETSAEITTSNKTYKYDREYVRKSYGSSQQFLQESRTTIGGKTVLSGEYFNDNAYYIDSNDANGIKYKSLLSYGEFTSGIYTAVTPVSVISLEMMRDITIREDDAENTTVLFGVNTKEVGDFLSLAFGPYSSLCAADENTEYTVNSFSAKMVVDTNGYVMSQSVDYDISIKNDDKITNIKGTVRNTVDPVESLPEISMPSFEGYQSLDSSYLLG